MEKGNNSPRPSFVLHGSVHLYVLWTPHICAGMLNIPIQGQGEALLPLQHSHWCESLLSFTLECEIKVVSLALRWKHLQMADIPGPPNRREGSILLPNPCRNAQHGGDR